MNDLESRLDAIESRIALDDLVVRYFVASDDDDLNTLASQFSADASFGMSGQVVAQGKEPIIEFIRQARTSMGLTIHTPNYTVFDFQDGDHASGLVGAHLELAISGKSLIGAVRYKDTYVRQNRQWLFQSRMLQVIHMGPWEEIARSLTEPLRVKWPGAEPKRSDIGGDK